ncbi:uncharacterized protein LOC128838003 [Malaclemys terrapin pileata]|uniref:uncharacterized protein LOC128838003 n=1 Tax=Malaclemys terrapin pileata TaxID=2991368 RepID=UPI0023A8FBAD|nr:uncharacterized protein LOC128838003 [Malaclemys terrapin pileata]
MEIDEQKATHHRTMALRQLEADKEMEAQATRQKADHESTMEIQKLAFEEKEKERKHELAILEWKRQNPTPGGSTSPKIHKWEWLCPAYSKSGDIAEYFIIFERICMLHAISGDQKMTTLVAKLTGRALDILNKMPMGDASNYGKCKDMVLKQFQITPDIYRVKFRSLKRGAGLSNVAYVNQMRDLLDKWVRRKGITSFEGMCDLVAQEQFLNMSSDDVKQCLWDKKVETVDELAAFANKFEQSQAPRGVKVWWEARSTFYPWEEGRWMGGWILTSPGSLLQSSSQI